jgi:PAS domain S-box-containing protein
MSTSLDLSLKVLYVQGLAADVDRGTTEQLRAASAELQITTIAGSAAALAELRRTPGWQALFASPSLPQNEILALIASLRRDRVPIAIVPIVDDAHQDLFASAVASGADDVLVRRAGSLVNVNETLTRIRQSPHLFPAEQRRRISVLYAGRDALVWNLLDQVPFVKADRVTTSIDGTCSVRRPGAGDDSLRADAVIIDEAPGDAHPLQVLKSVKAQASDLPVIMLTSAGAADIATAALELGADDTVLKTGIFRRRLIATLRRVHQRIELNAQQTETRTREERLRQIVENVPTGIMVVAADGRVLAMNAAALHLFGAGKPRDIVGRDFREMVETGHRDAVTDLIRKVTKGEAGSVTFDALTLGGGRLQAHIDAVVLERDARGGRGLVASIRRPEQRPIDAESGSADELATLRDTLERLERHYAELDDARTNERTAWESERQRLEVRLEAAERLASERSTIQERLDEVTAELGRTSESFAAERQTLQIRLQELEAATHEAARAGAVHASLEGSLGAVREELRQAIEAHALERSAWQEIRSDLEARVQQLDSAHRSEQDSLVAGLQQDVRRLELELADQGARWTATRQELELELRNAREALWAEHSDRDAARAASDAQLATLQARVDEERATWQAAQSALEQELARARDGAGTDQSEWQRTRADFEITLHELRRALDDERASRESDRTAFNQTRQELETTLEGERLAWLQQQQAFDLERQSFIDRGIIDSDLGAERSRLEAELDAARQQWHLERQAADFTLQQAYEQTGRLEEAHRNLADEYQATRARLEQERDEARVTVENGWRERVSELESRLQDAILRAEATAQALQDASDALTRRESEWSTVESEWQLRLHTLETTLADAAGRAAQLESDWINERSDLRQTVDAARSEAEQERGHLVSMHVREIEEWRQAVDRARGERDVATDRMNAIEAQLQDTRQQLDSMGDVRRALDSASRRLIWNSPARGSNLSRWMACSRNLTPPAVNATRHGSASTSSDKSSPAPGSAWASSRRSSQRSMRRGRSETTHGTASQVSNRSSRVPGSNSSRWMDCSQTSTPHAVSAMRHNSALRHSNGNWLGPGRNWRPLKRCSPPSTRRAKNAITHDTSSPPSNGTFNRHSSNTAPL